jgi:hypothetical protein
MEQSTIPSYWAKYPEWFKNSEWAINHQKTEFVMRLGNVICQIKMDSSERRNGDLPMQATRRFLSGDDAANATKHQYTEAVKLLSEFDAKDLSEATLLKQKFEEEFAEYLPYVQ